MTAIAKGFIGGGAAAAKGYPIALFVQSAIRAIDRNTSLYPEWAAALFLRIFDQAQGRLERRFDKGSFLFVP